MIINKCRSCKELVFPFLVLLLLINACKNNTPHTMTKGVELQRLILHLEFNDIDKEYELLQTNLNKIEQVVMSNGSLIDNVDLVHQEDLLTNIGAIRDKISLNQKEGLDHQIDNLKLHLEELEDIYGGDKHLFAIWNLETHLHNWMPKTESEYSSENVQSKMDGIHTELIKDLKILTLGKINHELVDWDETKYSSVQSYKPKLVSNLDKFILLKKKTVEYSQFKSSLDQLQNSIIEYLRLIL